MATFRVLASFDADAALASAVGCPAPPRSLRPPRRPVSDQRSRAARGCGAAEIVRLRKRSSPGSASEWWLLCAIARSVGVAAETAALVLEANANLASVGPDWPPAGPGGRVLLRPRVTALWCEYLVRRRPDGLFDAGCGSWRCTPSRSRHPGRGFVPRMGRWSRSSSHNVVTRTCHCRTSPIRSHWTDRPGTGSTASAGYRSASS